MNIAISGAAISSKCGLGLKGMGHGRDLPKPIQETRILHRLRGCTAPGVRLTFCGDDYAPSLLFCGADTVVEPNCHFWSGNTRCRVPGLYNRTRAQRWIRSPLPAAIR